MSASREYDAGSTPGTDDAEVMAAVDRADAVPTFIIADVASDGAWLSMPVAEVPSTPAWR